MLESTITEAQPIAQEGRSAGRNGRPAPRARVRQKKLSVVIINYNGRDVLPITLSSLKGVDHPLEEVILVDDCSTDDSIAAAKKSWPDVKVIRLPRNTKKPNRARNAGIVHARADLVFVMDNDIVLDPDCLTRLLEAHDEFPDAAICTPRLLDATDPTLIYTDGQKLHYLCNTIAPSRGKRLPLPADVSEDTAGGGVLLLDKNRACVVGFFDEEYGFGWGEDGEIYQKLTILGHKCYHVPSAVGYHFPKERTTQRAFYQVRNRWLLILETYSWRTILVLSPALILYEAMLFAMLLAKGSAMDYFVANKNLVRHLPRILLKRKIFQSLRKIPDRDRLHSGDIYVPPSLLNHWAWRTGLRATNGIFSSYWKLVRRIL